MKALKEMLRDLSGAEYAIAAAVVIVLVTIAGSGGSRSTPFPRLPAGLENYHGPRA